MEQMTRNIVRAYLVPNGEPPEKKPSSASLELVGHLKGSKIRPDAGKKGNWSADLSKISQHPPPLPVLAPLLPSSSAWKSAQANCYLLMRDW